MVNKAFSSRDLQIVEKILREIKFIEMACKDITRENFLGNELLQRAISMTLINIGELVKNLTEDFRKNDSTIPWRNISGMRDIAAHQYQTLKMEDVWLTVISDIPTFKDKLVNLTRING